MELQDRLLEILAHEQLTPEGAALKLARVTGCTEAAATAAVKAAVKSKAVTKTPAGLTVAA